MSKPKYQLVEPIGAGGMAVVHRAIQRGVGGFERCIAIEQILPELACRPDFVERFIREARLASALAHPNIVQIYDFGRSGTTYFLAMEYVEGRPLSWICRAAFDAGIPIPVEVVLSLVRQLCDALDHAHTRVGIDGTPLHIVHRDISLGNLLVSRAGHLKVIDFGIASVAAPATATAADDRVAGKVGYMAPETIRGERTDHRVDLFAVGVVAWELLTCRRLFADKSDDATIDRILHGGVTPPSSLAPGCGPEVDALVQSALAMRPDRRPASAAAMRDAIAAIETSRGAASSAVVARWLERVERQVCPRECATLEIEVSGRSRGTPSANVRDTSWPVEIAANPTPGATGAGEALAAEAANLRPAASRWWWSAAAALVIVAGVAVGRSATTSGSKLSSGSAVVAAAALRTSPARVSSPSRPAALPVSAPVPSPAAVTASRPAGTRHHADTARMHAPVRRHEVTVRPVATWPAPPRPIAVAPSRALAVTAPTVAVPVAPSSTAPSGPVTIRPDQVRRVSGSIQELDLERLKAEGLVGKRLAAIVCIDPVGLVSSVRILGTAPRWLRAAIEHSLRGFRFTTYRGPSGPVPACFARQLMIGARR